MNERLTFCESCRKETAFYVDNVSLKGKIKSREYSFSGKRAVCHECGNEVYVADIEDNNLKELYDSYRQYNGIISLEKTQEIPRKYNIGKRPISLLLNWGEMTFTRYCDGYIPTKQYSDILQRLYNEPDFYLSLLEKQKANLKSEKAYIKSRKTTLELLGKHGYGNIKIYHAVDYLLYRCEDITPLSLQKALYYIQGFYYAFMNRFLFINDCEAWIHGPVYREVYDHYSSYRFDPIKSIDDFDFSIIADAEKSIMDSVIQNICCYSGKILEQFTHSEMPWIKTRADLSAGMNSNRIISKEFISEYFTAVKQEYDMSSPKDIENYTKSMFSRTNPD
jgi:uncharacterized phage-associated protein